MARPIDTARRGWVVYRDLGLIYQGDFDWVLRQLTEDCRSGTRTVWLNSQEMSMADLADTEIKADQSRFRLFLERDGVRLPSARDLMISAPIEARPIPTPAPSERPTTPARPVNRGGRPEEWLWPDPAELPPSEQPFEDVAAVERWLQDNATRLDGRPAEPPDMRVVRRAIKRRNLLTHARIRRT
jgi:hypothetical protein